MEIPITNQLLEFAARHPFFSFVIVAVIGGLGTLLYKHLVGDKKEAEDDLDSCLDREERKDKIILHQHARIAALETKMGMPISPLPLEADQLLRLNEGLDQKEHE